MKKCNACKTELDDTVLFCTNCGLKVGIVNKVCQNCNASNDSLSIFCVFCGEKFESNHVGNLETNVFYCKNLSKISEESKIESEEINEYNEIVNEELADKIKLRSSSFENSNVLRLIKKPAVIFLVISFFAVRLLTDTPTFVVFQVYKAASSGDMRTVQENTTASFVSNEEYDESYFDSSPEDGYEIKDFDITRSKNGAEVYLEVDQHPEDDRYKGSEMAFSVVKINREWLVDEVYNGY